MQYEIKADSRVSVSYSLNNNDNPAKKDFRKSRTRMAHDSDDELEFQDRSVSITMSVNEEMEFQSEDSENE